MRFSFSQFHTGGADRGFSLVETVVYIALFVTLSTVLVGTLYGMLRAYTHIRVNDDLLDSAHVSMERMSREVRNAVSIDPTSNLGATPGLLTLDALDSGGAPKTVTFDVTPAGALEVLDSSDGVARTLTGSKVQVSSLTFRSVTTTTGAAVRIEVTFRSLRSAVGQTVDLTDTIVLRGSY